MSRLMCGLVWQFASIVRAGASSGAAWVRDCRGNSAGWPFSRDAPHQLRARAILAVGEAESSWRKDQVCFAPLRCICFLPMLGCGISEALRLSVITSFIALRWDPEDHQAWSPSIDTI